MEFDEMKTIWDSQNSHPLYVVDEKAVYRRIQSKLNLLLRATNISDWFLIIIYLVAGSILLVLNAPRPGSNIFLSIESIMMFAVVVYFIASHVRKIKASRRFDRSVQGDLDHTISLTSHQIHMSQIIRWSLLPMGAIMLLSGWVSGHFIKVGAIILISYTLAFFGSSKGIQSSKKRKLDLQSLKEKLEAEN